MSGDRQTLPSNMAVVAVGGGTECLEPGLPVSPHVRSGPIGGGSTASMFFFFFLFFFQICEIAPQFHNKKRTSAIDRCKVLRYRYHRVAHCRLRQTTMTLSAPTTTTDDDAEDDVDDAVDRR